MFAIVRRLTVRVVTEKVTSMEIGDVGGFTVIGLCYWTICWLNGAKATELIAVASVTLADTKSFS
jgi:hypothetical protein